VSLRRQLARGVRALVNRAAADRDVADEVRDYLDRATAAHVARGLSHGDAVRAAQLELGNMTAVRERVRGYGWENAVDTLVADLRFAIRRLRTNPGFAIVSVLTLALGIGASTAIFSAVNPILFEPLPYPHASRIAAISDVAGDGSPADVTFGTYRELAARNRSFDAIAVFKAWQPTMLGDAEPERIAGQRVTADYFRVLGVPPVIGRDFQDTDDRTNAPNVVILSDALWRRRFGADPAIVGRDIKLADNNYSVIGVMPAGFENVVAPSALAWTTLEYDRSLPIDGREWGHHLRMIGRLRSGIDMARAALQLDAVARTPLPEFHRVPWASLSGGMIVHSLQDDTTRGVRPALLAVLGAVVLVLVIACVNVTNLLLTRAAQRRGEFAMRAALGAGRTRLIRQLLTESLLLAIIGGVLGLVVAELGVRALVALSPPGLPRVDAIRVDGAVFAFGMVVTTVIGFVVGVIPALHASREDLRTGLQESSRRTAGDHRFTRASLVVAEVALALVLLVSAGLLMRSLEHLFAVAPGFDAPHLLTMQVQASGRQFDDTGATNRFYDRALDAVRHLPSVAAAAFTSQLPLSGDFDGYGVHFENDVDPSGDGSALRYAVTPDYFKVMGIPLRRGRLLGRYDIGGAPFVVLLNESFAKRKFPGQNPIGRRMHVGPADGPWYTIVGIVGDVKHTSLAAGELDAVYIPSGQWFFADRVRSLVVRSRAGVAALVPAMKAAIWSADKNQAIVRVATMDQLVAATAADRRFALTLFELFGLVALLLAAIGIYGVLSGNVSERTREIGVRSALGASPSDILTLVIRQGMSLAALGVVIGASGAVVASRALVTLLFGVSRLDPVTYAGVIVLLVGVSLVACGVPAWRAARVDPACTLRAS
jgi:putative ABC transport system permease protein